MVLSLALSEEVALTFDEVTGLNIQHLTNAQRPKRGEEGI